MIIFIIKYKYYPNKVIIYKNLNIGILIQIEKSIIYEFLICIMCLKYETYIK